MWRARRRWRYRRAPVDRRILGPLLSLAHAFLAVSALAVFSAVASEVLIAFFGIPGIGFSTAPAPTPGSGATDASSAATLVLSAAIVGLLLWWVLLRLYGRFILRAGMRLAQEGQFLQANERLRKFLDREPLLRLLGLSGATWKRARIITAYNDYLHGLASEAIALALPESRGLLRVRTPLRWTAALVVASTGAEAGDLAALDAIGEYLEHALVSPRSAPARQLLAMQGIAWANTLRLDEAGTRADWLRTFDPSDRLALTLHAQVATIRGDFEAALRDLDAALASPALQKGGAAQRVMVRQMAEASRAFVLLELGRREEARAIAARLLEERPRHRVARFAAAALPALAAESPDADLASRAVAALRGLADEFSFDPMMRARAAIAIARIERTGGAPDRALAALGDAIACPIPVWRQNGLYEQALAKEAAGDAGGAKQSWEWLLAVGPDSGAAPAGTPAAPRTAAESRFAREARARLGRPASSAAGSGAGV